MSDTNSSAAGSHLWQLNDFSPVSQLRFAWRMRRVWWFTATARTMARFARTKLGSLWLGLTTLLSIGVLAMVYGTVFKVDHFGQYTVFLGVGLLLWNSLAGAVGGAPILFAQHRDSINNVNLPPLFYALEEWAFQLQTFFQSLVMVLLGLTFFQPSLFPNLILYGLPGMLNYLLFLFWLPLVLCLIGARYKDLYHLVPVVMQLAFLLSPILYSKENLGRFQWIASFNPFYQSLSSLRHSIIHGGVEWRPVMQFFLVNLIGLGLSLAFLRKEQKVLPFLV